MDTEKQDVMRSPGTAGEEVAGSFAGFHSLPRREVFLTLAGVMLAMFLSSLDQTVVSTAMPRIMADLGGFDQYTWVTTSYLVTSTVAMPIVGRLTDMYGRKWFYIVGIAIFLVCSALSGLAQTLTQLIIFRALQGIGGGIMMANAFIVIGDLFPPAERGKYQGLVTAVFGLSAVIGPLLGGFITDRFSWHWIFYINLPLGIPIVALFIRFFPPMRPSGVRHRIDFLGLTALILCVVPLMLGLSWGGVQYGWTSSQIVGALSMSALMGVLFVLVESRAAEPIIPLAIFRNREVALSSIAIFCAGFGMFGATIFIPLYFQGVLGLSATASGSFLMPMMLGVMAGSLVSGQVLARLGGHYRIQGVIGLAIMATGMFLLSRMTADTTYGQAIFAVVVTGIGLGTAMPLYMIAVQNAVPYRVMGIATASVQFFRAIGGTLGLAIFGSLLASRFASNLETLLPVGVKQAVPPDVLSQLSSNPEALVDPNAVSNLQQMFGSLGPQGVDLMQQLMYALREALARAISDIFILGVAAVAVGLIATALFKELPLRKRFGVEGVGEGQPQPLEPAAGEAHMAKANPGHTRDAEQDKRQT